MRRLERECRLGGRFHRLREAGAADQEQVERLFALVFGQAPPDGWYRWKYGALGGRAVGLWDANGELVAHYAGFPRRLLWQGKPLLAIQIGDVMVAPAARGILGRKGAFFQVCAAFLGKWVGAGAEHAFAFGFPNERAMRLGRRLGLYEDLRPVRSLRWPARRGGPRWFWRAREISAHEASFDRCVADAWHAMRRAMPHRVFGMRDAAYVRTRFAARPGTRYRYLEVSRRGYGPQAVAVAREEGEALRWVDFIGPPAALAQSARALQQLAAQAGLASVEVFASGAACEELRAAGGQDGAEIGRFAIANPSRFPTDALVHQGWWLGGDSDFL